MLQGLNLTYLIIIGPILLIALTVHEFAHAWMANRLGDPTAKLSGRLTLNPIAHLDPVGTIMLVISLLGGFAFGWGKPVPVDPYNLRNPRRDNALIALSGPASNLLLAVITALLFRFIPNQIIQILLIKLIVVNVSLGIFNLIPISPLDGGSILVGFLPEGQARGVELFLHQNGMLLLIILIFPFFGSSLIFKIIGPIINFILTLLLPQTPII